MYLYKKQDKRVNSKIANRAHPEYICGVTTSLDHTSLALTHDNLKCCKWFFSQIILCYNRKCTKEFNLPLEMGLKIQKNLKLAKEAIIEPYPLLCKIFLLMTVGHFQNSTRKANIQICNEACHQESLDKELSSET